MKCKAIRSHWQGLVTVAALAAALLAVSPAARADEATDRMLADQLAVLTRWVLQGPGEPVPAQFTQAQMLLDEALALRPEDAELWHLRIELAETMADDAARLEALRRYAALHPEDNAAATELALTEVMGGHAADELEQAEGIEALLQRLRDAMEAEHRDAVRSRLASQGAALAFELGDDTQMRELLATAVRLDRHNVQAARLLLQRAMRREAGNRQVGMAAINLVRRAPAEPLGRLALAEALLREADYTGAAQQFEVTQRLATAGVGRRGYLSWAIALAGQGDDETLGELLDGLSARYAEQGEEPDSPLEGDLPLDFELLRFATTPRSEALARQVERMVDRYEERELALTRSQRRGAQLELASTASLFGQHLDQIEPWLADHDRDEAQAQRILGLTAMHQGDTKQAREYLEPVAETDALAALGLAELESGGARLEALEAIVRREPHRLAGVIAARRLREAGQQVSPGEAARVLRQSMLDDSRQLWEPALRSSPWLVMRVRAEPARADYLEPIRVRVELRNAARFAMALEPDAGIPTQAVLLLSPRVAGRPLPPPGPVVVDLRRRLVLEPGERVSAEVRLDRTAFGAMSGANPQLNITYGVRGLLGARRTRGGGLAPGPVGYQDELRAMNINAVRITSEAEFDEILEQLEAGTEAQRLRALAVLARLGESLPAPLDGPEPRQRIAEAVIDAYAGLDTRQQAFVQRFVRRPEDDYTLLAELLEQVRGSDEPLVWMVHLTAQAQDDNHASLSAALEHENEAVRRFAEARRDAVRHLAQMRERAERQRELEQRQRQQLEEGPVELDLDL